MYQKWSEETNVFSVNGSHNPCKHLPDVFCGQLIQFLKYHGLQKSIVKLKAKDKKCMFRNALQKMLAIRNTFPTSFCQRAGGNSPPKILAIILIYKPRTSL